MLICKDQLGTVANNLKKQEEKMIVMPFDDAGAVSEVGSSADDDFSHGELEQQFAVVDVSRPSCDYSLWLKIQVAVARFLSPALALFTTISLPIFIIYVNEQVNSQGKAKSVSDVLLPAFFWLLLAMNRQWLVWNNVAHRSDGREDNEIEVVSNVQRQDPWHVVIALIANTPSATNALLVVFSVLSSANPVAAWGLAIVLSVINYVSDMLTDLPSTYRKHAEVCEMRGQAVLPLFEQALVKSFYDRALCPALVVREVSPVLNGIIRSAAIVSVLNALDSQALLTAIVGILMYCSTAYTITNFEIAQLKDSMHAAGQEFELANAWSRSSHLPLRIVGRFLSGQLLMDALKKCKLSSQNSVNLMLSISALGLIAIVHRALHDYVSSDNSADQALVTRFLVGPEKAVEIGKDAEFFMRGTAVALGTLGTFKSWATVQKEARDYDLPVRVNASVVEMAAR